MIKAQKFLTNVLCVSMAVSNITPVFATVTNDTLAFEDTDTTTLEQTEVLYEKAGSYFVTIPKIISLGIDKQSPYSVKVEGDIPSDRQVYVSPIDGIKDLDGFNFYMKDQSTTNPKADVVATVTQTKFCWDFGDVANGYTETNNHVAAEDLTSGTWRGTFDFEINMHTVEPEKPDFTLTTDGDVTIPAGETHQLNAYIDGVESNSDVVWSCDNDEITINNGLIEIPSSLQAGTEITITVTKDGKDTSFIVTVGEEDAVEIKDWIYTLDDTNKIITLKQYTGSDTDVTVHNKYKSGNTIYRTKIASNNKKTDYMFCSNYTVESIKFESGIDTSETYSTQYMFNNCIKLRHIDFGNLETCNTTNMREMFMGCSKLTDLDLSSFDTSNVTDMGNMFSGCKSLTELDLSNFDTGNVTNMSCMFQSCSSLTNIDLSSFDTSNVTNMYGMFRFCSLPSLDLSNFDTGNVTDMRYMFGYSSVINLDLSNFDTSRVTEMQEMFTSCNLLTEINLSSFNTSNVTNMCAMFAGCKSLTELDLSNFNTGNVTQMSQMFDSCKSLTELDLSSFNTSKAKNMDTMFGNCTSLKTIYVTQNKWSTSQATKVDMFWNCGTSSVTYK